MIEKLISLDKELFLYLNSIYSNTLDPLMLAFSSYTMWTIVFLLLAFVLYYFRSVGQKKIIVVYYMLTVGAAAALTNLLKVFVKRPRPIHESNWQGIIRALEEYESSYSFFSSHSSTTFAIATFFFLAFKRSRIAGALALVWAFCVSYSRIYVGKHYPLDVTCGIIFGIVMGILGDKLYERFAENKGKL